MKFIVEGKDCERCKNAVAIKGKRFCSECQKEVLKEMRESGYLQPLPPKRKKTEDDEPPEGDDDIEVTIRHQF